MERRYAIVTGANKGMGRAIAEGLAAAGSDVLLACRDESRADEAAAAIRAETGNPNVGFAALDLASTASVRSFVAEVLARGRPVDALVNNAGALRARLERTADGLERTVQTNYVGLFQLTTALAPILHDGSCRVVGVSSLMYRFGRIDDDLFRNASRPYDRFKAYADSKLAALLFCLELADRLEARGVRVAAIDPGIVDTGILRMDSFIDPICDLVFRPLVRRPEDAARAVVRLASGNGPAASFTYYVRDEPRTLSRRILAHPARAELWARTERLLTELQGLSA